MVINTLKFTISNLDQILETKQYFSVFLYFRSYGHFFGPLVFYLFGLRPSPGKRGKVLLCKKKQIVGDESYLPLQGHIKVLTGHDAPFE